MSLIPLLLQKKKLQGSKVNQIDEALLDVNNVYLTTEEGYLMVEEDNKNNIIIQED